MCLHLTNEFPSSLHFFCWGIKNNAMTGLLKEIPTKKNLIRLNYENQIRLIEQNEMSEKSNIFLKPIDKIEFSARTLNCLKNENIICIVDLVQETENSLLRHLNFGRKSLNEVKEVLQKKSLNLGMEISNWPPENYEKLVKSYDISSDIKFDFYSLKEMLDKKFNDREKIIYDQRFSRGKPSEFIGKKLNITRERVRQIEVKLIRRVLKYKDAFKNFLSSERNYIFSKFSNNSSLITFKTSEIYSKKNYNLLTDKDFIIKFCIFIVYKNKTNFLNEEYYPVRINKFIKRKTAKRSRIENVQAWKKEKKIKENKKVNSGIFKLYNNKGEISE